MIVDMCGTLDQRLGVLKYPSVEPVAHAQVELEQTTFVFLARRPPGAVEPELWSEPNRVRYELCVAQDWICPLCDTSLPNPATSTLVEIDHIEPQSRGGSHKLINLQAVHKRCNASKGDNPNRPNRLEARSHRQGKLW